MNIFAQVLIGIALLYIIYKLKNMDETLERLDAATNEIAADLAALRDQLKDSLTAEQKARLDAAVTRLEGLGQDPENPIP